MASNMDREMILADFQVKCLALLAPPPAPTSTPHLQLGGFGVAARWPLPSVCLSTAVVVVWGFSTPTWLRVCVYCEPWGNMYFICCIVCVCVWCVERVK